MSHAGERVTRDAAPAAPRLHGATLALVRALWLREPESKPESRPEAS